MATNTGMLTMAIVSLITEQDFEVLYQIEQLAHQVPWSKGILKNNQGKNYCNLKLEVSEKKIIGFAICHCVLDEATLFNIAIAPNFQGQGFGKFLLNALIEKLRQQNIVTLWLEVRQSNHTALKLYQQFGFNQVDIRKNYYPTSDGKRENAIIMALSL